nr:uncharacterized protein LOC104111813 [Nicotiana tomentosiformis]
MVNVNILKALRVSPLWIIMPLTEAKRSQEFTKEAVKRSQELTIDVVSEASKRSKEIAAEASKRSKEIVVEASRRADQIKAASLSQLVDSSSSTSPQSALDAPSVAELDKFGVTNELREFVKGISMNTFPEFPLQDESQMSDIPTVSNVRQDLTEFQENTCKTCSFICQGNLKVEA